MSKLATRKEVLEFEKLPLPELPNSTYEVIVDSAKKYSNRKALHFFLQARSAYASRVHILINTNNIAINLLLTIPPEVV